MLGVQVALGASAKGPGSVLKRPTPNSRYTGVPPRGWTVGVWDIGGVVFLVFLFAFVSLVIFWAWRAGRQ